MSRPNRPDFLCIGPEKTGTTWLYDLLRSHPDVWLPPVKETRFLNEGSFLVPRHSLGRVLFSNHWHYKGLRKHLLSIPRRMAKALVRPGTWGDAGWVFRYCLGRRSFSWYGNLYRAAGDRLCGDISPLHYHVSEDRIRELAEHNPSTRILILLRDPVARIWSKSLMMQCAFERRAPSDVSDEQFVEYFDHLHDWWLPYDRTIALWQARFESVFVGAYDTLCDAPEEFFGQVCGFLGLDPSLATASLGHRVNEGMREPIRPALEQYLRRQYRSEVDALAVTEYGQVARRWLGSWDDAPAAT